jgi:hypothetical protein
MKGEGWFCWQEITFVIESTTTDEKILGLQVKLNFHYKRNFATGKNELNIHVKIIEYS